MFLSVFRLLLLFILAVISGCASNIKSTHIDSKVGVPPGHGVVAVQVASNAERLSRHNTQWTEVLVVRIDNLEEKKARASTVPTGDGKFKKEWSPDVYSLMPNNEGMASSQVFVGAMPPGTYFVAQLWSFFSRGDFQSTLSMPVGKIAGTFEVKQGHLTDLGTLIFQPIENVAEPSFWTNSSSRKAYVTRVESREDLAQFVGLRFPEIKSAISLGQPIGWTADKFDELRIGLGQLSKNNAYGNRIFRLSHHGKALITARLGLLRWQDQSGQWHASQLDTQREMQAVLETPSQIILGGELGTAYYSDRIDGKWQRANPVAPTEAIVWMGGVGGQYYALTKHKREHYAYRFKSITEQWERIGQFVPEDSFFHQPGDPDDPVLPILTKAGTLRVFIQDVRHDYNLETNAWTKNECDFIRKVARALDGTLVALHAKTVDLDIAVSLDDGLTWKTLPRRVSFVGNNSAYTALPVVSEDKSVVSVDNVYNKTVKTDSDGSETAVTSSGYSLRIVTANYQAFDDVKSWQRSERIKNGCASLIPELSKRDAVYALCDQGGIVFTRDLGVTWEDVVPIDYAAMQAGFDKLIATVKTEDVEPEDSEPTE